MKDDQDLLYAVAVMYYQDRLNQEEISKRMNLSRPMVSRLLAKAQECGIVRITVQKPEPLGNLAEKLGRILEVEKVYIAPNAHVMKDGMQARLEDISDYASQIMISELKDMKNIGVGWGMTVYRTVMKMVEKSVTDYSAEHNVVPIVGSVGVREVQYQVNIIVSLLAHVLGASVYFYNSAEADRKDFGRKYGELFGIWNELDAVLFSLGPAPSKQRRAFDVISGKQPDGIGDVSGAVGDILGQFFSENGKINSTWEDGYIGLSIEKLMNVGRRICLCGGTDKVDAMITAARFGLYNVLVTDARTAEEILERKGERL
ncbi:MAG: hypothetical protein IKR80_01050 [Spirochaetales bacterium]|nr:hypothetical protein [Spirochaetales bacterium]MBR6347519.1 hypothetical protein [Spirochaetales bacterium]